MESLNKKIKSNKSIIMYLSPAGTTRKVAGFISKSLINKGYNTQLFDLGKSDLQKNLKDAIDQLEKNDCLWIGSPIYAGHAVPPIESFVSDLSQVQDVFAVPFVTYGAVTSGTGLYEMAIQLSKKGYIIPGAAKILAVHSLLWFSGDPLGKGHPDPDDEKLLDDLVTLVQTKIGSHDLEKNIDLATLNYQSKKVQEHTKTWNLKELQRNMPPIIYNEEKCTVCGMCVENCPVQNISFETFPKIGTNCILCFNCIRYCESKALTNTVLNVLENLIRDRVKEIEEPMESKIFF